jgi:thymidylate synthase
MMDWPILYKNVLKVKNPESPVGVAIMWTEREVVASMLEGLNYSVVGNLYSSAGISAVIRNVFANPKIRFILLWGADLSRSGQALLSFMEKGVDENYFIIGDEKGGQIEKDIPKKDIELFRKSITIVNLRGKSPDDLRKEVQKLGKKAVKPFTKAKTFPTSRKKPFTFPSEQIGFRVSGKTTALTWLRLLNIISRYGRIKTTRYAKENELKEILNLVAVVREENINNPYLPHYFPFTKRDLDVYYPQVLSAKKIPGIAYTYGQRLRDNDGVDQVQEVIELIKRRPFSKKMAMFTANVSHDWGRSTIDKGDTPCLTQVICSIQDNKLIMTTHFRSQDMVHGWPRNVFSLLKLQELIAKETGYERGQFCMITHSAHMYSDDFTLVDNILKDNFIKELPFTPAQHFEEDLRGNFTIEVVGQELLLKSFSGATRGSIQYSIDSRSLSGMTINKLIYKPGSGKIKITLYAPNGGLALKSWEGRTATEVYLQMTDWDYFSMPAHAADMGVQLTRAEYAIKFGWEYSQDIGPNKL